MRLRILEKLGLPMVIKLVSGSQGKGVVLAETRKAAKSVIQALYVTGASTLLQEYIEESSGTDVRAFVVGNRVIASMERSSSEDFRSNLHQGGTGKPARLTELEKKTAIKSSKAMGLQICGVDMLRSNRGPLVLEVNSNPGIEGIEAVTGRDVAGKIIDHVEINAKLKNGKRQSRSIVVNIHIVDLGTIYIPQITKLLLRNFSNVRRITVQPVREPQIKLIEEADLIVLSGGIWLLNNNPGLHHRLGDKIASANKPTIGICLAQNLWLVILGLLLKNLMSV